MSSYEPYEPLGEFPLPPGVKLPTGFPQIADITKQLGLPEFGIYTPWGARTSGVTWEDVQQPPDTNIAVFGINDNLLAAAQTIALNQPIPFVAVLTDAASTPDHVEKVLKGTPYKFYQTQAVYRQSDAAPTPRIYFLHWAERRQPGDSDHGSGNLTQAAVTLGGKLTYSMQVNYNTTSSRPVPGVPFQSALAAQMAGGGETPAPPPPPDLPPPPTEPPARASMVGPVLLGAGVAAVTFFAVREMQKRGK